MTVYYLDASAWVKRYCHEAGTIRVQEMFTDAAILTCSGLGLVEVAATLCRKARAGEISTPDRDAGLAELQRDWQGFVQLRAAGPIFTSAVRMARDQSLRGADAIHLASALSLEESLAHSEHRLIMATSDRELKRAAESAGLAVFDPED